jgi:mRNA interferase MazF
MKRFDIYYARLDPVVGSEIGKTRPCVIISDDERNRWLQTVVICPITSQLRDSWRSRLRMECARRPADICVDQIRTIHKSRLTKKIDRLKPSAIQSLKELIIEMYAF